MLYFSYITLSTRRKKYQNKHINYFVSDERNIVIFASVLKNSTLAERGPAGPDYVSAGQEKARPVRPARGEALRHLRRRPQHAGARDIRRPAAYRTAETVSRPWQLVSADAGSFSECCLASTVGPGDTDGW